MRGRSCEQLVACVSGTNDLDDRPALGALLDRLENNGIKVVIVEDVTRLARRLMVQECILEDCRKLGIKCISATSGTDLTADDDDNPEATAMRQMLGVFSQYNKAVIVHKLRAGRERQRRTTGRREGRKPYGHRPGEGLVVDRIVALRRKPRGGERASFAEIADLLNTDGVPTRYGKPWNAAVIRSICLRAAKQSKGAKSGERILTTLADCGVEPISAPNNGTTVCIPNSSLSFPPTTVSMPSLTFCKSQKQRSARPSGEPRKRKNVLPKPLPKRRPAMRSVRPNKGGCVSCWTCPPNRRWHRTNGDLSMGRYLDQVLRSTRRASPVPATASRMRSSCQGSRSSESIPPSMNRDWKLRASRLAGRVALFGSTQA
ncbi:MAG TPA: recombinase family protein [Planctomycetaceae bacterium]|jgi:DNA invertase Pin-like site-specific DNA recombinase|nr:recombinase family protein [Planctomycetaceae bacterium]